MIELLICHLIGDFLLQPKNMAIEKGTNSLVCLLHILVYTVPFGIYLSSTVGYIPWLLASIAVPHFIIDRLSLAEYWARLIKGRSFKSFVPVNNPNVSSLDIAFTCIVYTITDFTFHLICLYASWKIFLG